ncbi:MAG: hypothetical protein QXG02_02205, partial [Candidatus Anstonellales archaeon]
YNLKNLDTNQATENKENKDFEYKRVSSDGYKVYRVKIYDGDTPEKIKTRFKKYYPHYNDIKVTDRYGEELTEIPKDKKVYIKAKKKG